MYQSGLKRCLDLIVAVVALACFLPLLAIVALIVKMDSPGPVLFKQDRLGWRGRIFRIHKFRTMHHAPRAVDREVFADHPDVTRAGRWLRRYKLDELPQFWHVLCGDMSVVGPRPAMPEQERILNDDGRRRLEVRPGLTGLAQVNGSIYLSWEERWKLDRLYVESLSFCLDVRILVKTVGVILLGEQRFRMKHELTGVRTPSRPEV